VKKTRTQFDPKYGPANRLAVARTAYREKMAIAWLKQNREDVWEQIEELAYKKFPALKRPNKIVDISELPK
jgi:hypothetical protein